MTTVPSPPDTPFASEQPAMFTIGHQLVDRTTAIQWLCYETEHTLDLANAKSDTELGKLL